MIRNLLGCYHSTVRLDKVSRVLPGGMIQVIDEPAAVISEVVVTFSNGPPSDMSSPYLACGLISINQSRQLTLYGILISWMSPQL